MAHLEPTQQINLSDDNSQLPDDEEDEEMAYLEVGSRTYTLHKGENKIGRDPAVCRIVLDSKALSKIHASIDIQSFDNHHIYDMESRNKTKLGKVVLKPYIRYQLQGGETIKFADMECLYKKRQRIVEDDGSDTDCDAIADDVIDNGNVNADLHDNDESKNDTPMNNEDKELEEKPFLVPETPHSNNGKISNQFIPETPETDKDDSDFLEASSTSHQALSQSILSSEDDLFGDDEEAVFSTPEQLASEPKGEDMLDMPTQRLIDEPTEQLLVAPTQRLLDVPTQILLVEPTERLLDDRTERFVDESNETSLDVPTQRLLDEPSQSIQDNKCMLNESADDDMLEDRDDSIFNQETQAIDAAQTQDLYNQPAQMVNELLQTLKESSNESLEATQLVASQSNVTQFDDLQSAQLLVRETAELLPVVMENNDSSVSSVKDDISLLETQPVTTLLTLDEDGMKSLNASLAFVDDPVTSSNNESSDNMKLVLQSSGDPDLDKNIENQLSLLFAQESTLQNPSRSVRMVKVLPKAVVPSNSMMPSPSKCLVKSETSSIFNYTTIEHSYCMRVPKDSDTSHNSSSGFKDRSNKDMSLSNTSTASPIYGSVASSSSTIRPMVVKKIRHPPQTSTPYVIKRQVSTAPQHPTFTEPILPYESDHSFMEDDFTQAAVLPNDEDLLTLFEAEEELRRRAEVKAPPRQKLHKKNQKKKLSKTGQNSDSSKKKAAHNRMTRKLLQEAEAKAAAEEEHNYLMSVSQSRSGRGIRPPRRYSPSRDINVLLAMAASSEDEGATDEYKMVLDEEEPSSLVKKQFKPKHLVVDLKVEQLDTSSPLSSKKKKAKKNSSTYNSSLVSDVEESTESTKKDRKIKKEGGPLDLPVPIFQSRSRSRTKPTTEPPTSPHRSSTPPELKTKKKFPVDKQVSTLKTGSRGKNTVKETVPPPELESRTRKSLKREVTPTSERDPRTRKTLRKEVTPYSEPESRTRKSLKKEWLPIPKPESRMRKSIKKAHTPLQEQESRTRKSIKREGTPPAEPESRTKKSLKKEFTPPSEPESRKRKLVKKATLPAEPARKTIADKVKGHSRQPIKIDLINPESLKDSKVVRRRGRPLKFDDSTSAIEQDDLDTSEYTKAVKRQRGRPSKKDLDSLAFPAKSQVLLSNDVPSSSRHSTFEKLKPKVMFTGYEDEDEELIVRDLGGTLVDSPTDCSVLVTDKVRRTYKFLCIMGRGKPIVSNNWLVESRRAKSFVDPWNYIIKDKEIEQKYKFDLSTSLRSSSQSSLLSGFSVYISTNVVPAYDQMRGIVECAGGMVLTSVPTSPPDKFFCISSLEAKRQWGQLKKAKAPIVGAEVLLTGLLQHNLDFEKFKLV